MNQTRLESLVEVIIGVIIGWIIGLLTQLLAFPLFGINVSFADQFLLSVIFTIVSIIRGYAIRRWFNAGIHKLVANSIKKFLG
jgi:uncharacterized protein YacL